VLGKRQKKKLESLGDERKTPKTFFFHAFRHFVILQIMHSFNSCLMHCVFSTQERRPWLTPAICERLWPYLGGIARENGVKAIAIGGTADHVHMLLSLPATIPLSKAMQLLKGNSSKWLRDTFPELRPQGFAWQEGFGAFSIGISGMEETVQYIQTQEEHHRKKSFREEFESFLKKHGCDFKPAMLD
jgi:putative transposase